MVDSTANQPVPGVQVREPGGRRVDTDQAGRFRLFVPDRSNAMITFRRLGYSPREKAAAAAPGADLVDLGTVLMPQIAVDLDPIRVEREQRKVDIAGTVVDSSTGLPLEGVRVWLPSGQTGYSDKRGAFRLKGVQGAAALVLGRRIGYMPRAKRVVLTRDSTTVVVDTLSLVAIIIRLDSIKIEAALLESHAMYRDFYRRKSQRRGMYLTADQIWKKNPSVASDVFWGLLGTNKRCAMGPPPRGVNDNNWQGCWILLNGCRANFLINGSTPLSGLLLDEVPPQSIVGVEIYRSYSDNPSELTYNPGFNPRCGTIVVWTSNRDILTWAAYREEP